LKLGLKTAARTLARLAEFGQDGLVAGSGHKLSHFSGDVLMQKLEPLKSRSSVAW